MTPRTTALFWGTFLGGIHGTILFLSMSSLSLASFILTGNRYYYPLYLTAIVDIVGLATVLSSTWWLPWAMELQERYEWNREKYEFWANNGEDEK